MNETEFFEKKQPKRVTICLLTLLALLFSFTRAGADSEALLQTAAPGKTYTLCGLKGLPLSFTAQQLEKQMGLADGSLTGIILSDLPNASEGSLTLGGEPAVVYETIGREGIARLLFTPKKGTSDTSFHFVPLVANGGESTAQLCITLLDSPNRAPVLSATPIATLEGVRVQGSFSLQDEDPSSVTLRVSVPCEKGELRVTGQKYSYEPYPGMTGSDSFTCVATDRYGVSGAPVTVAVRIEKSSGKVSYADMAGDPNAYAALKLAGLGQLVGEKAGDSYLFYPSRTVNGGEFLMMLLAVSGGSDSLPATVNTGLSNDAKISMWLKPYVQQAKNRGILGGSVGGVSYDCSSPVTEAQAAVMAARAAGVPDVQRSSQTLQGAAGVPSWAVQAYLNLAACGVLSQSDASAAGAALTRSRAAGLLWGVYEYRAAHGSPALR